MNIKVQDSDTSFFSSDVEEKEKLRKRLKKEKIKDLREHDFGNGVSYVQYNDRDNTRHTIVYGENGRGQYSKNHSGGVLYNWKHEVTNSGAEVFTDPENENNKLRVSSTYNNALVFDTTNYREQGSAWVGKEKEIRFNIKSDGNIELTNINGDQRNRVFFKNGDKLQTIGENGKLVDVKEIDKQELLEASKGLSGVRESKENKLNPVHSNRINSPSLSKESPFKH